MDLDDLRKLTVEKLREEAEHDRTRGLDHLAELGHHQADVVERGIREWWTEALTPSEAAAECAWSQDTIAKRIGDTLPQAGEPYKPRVRRCDLYSVVAGGPAPGGAAPQGPDVAGEVLREMA